MVRPIALLALLLPLAGCSTPVVDGKPETTVLLQASQAWDGTRYQSYPGGQPQLTLLKILIPPRTTLDWHQHPMPNAGYLLAGELLVETHDAKHLTLLKAGDALAETVGRTHRGRTGEQAAELIVFYAGNTTLPLSQADPDQASAPHVSP
ncbi:cupin domain-containing protein [Pseudomonas sp. 148P]|uniref:Cupin domain-containing protein n=1 Tax=Pseudomonas ulcerans TaxID=3115852 RepID=A0ABU7HUT6_9PSED|nr:MULTISPECIES: cupin domain-containing protein [unclassified Pseudomonas]MEE1924183.1 cupin domain-containing protein [Pseudomonas sp. 147P]MEE1935264.1 cupin domain-containing protein [Pseudomonas sp. 148P]